MVCTAREFDHVKKYRFHRRSYATGRVREQNGKPCVTNVTVVLFEITFRQTSLSFEQIFL